ncbi:glycosyl transferase family 1 [Pseudomonas tohonis]|uniref:Glycosyl transferase family 1 n=1 Tax=Pseudomonas tohonis TaxID=2725477 RepID=A0A6J4DYR6_9PSED|nr:glycosyltransferase family 4 protein [Pseudomonas tohonis]BCG22753.1 glycosyl transferase family 1 [Pseudomonas tohonis]GJN55843.1 glycosyl transferase family 1 [Pseudomonas tohonis]
MRVLFIHQNFPGQFRHLAAHLAKRDDVEVLAIGREQAPGLPGVRLLRYKPHRKASAQTHPYVRTFEDGVLHGQQVLRLLLDLKGKGYRPDVVVAHPGWGESLYVKEAFPSARLIHFCEYYYQARGADAGFDPEFPLDTNGAASIRSRNALHLLNLENCDLAITPTHWQRSVHPAAYREGMRVIHEGIDIAGLGPDPEASLQLPDGRVLKAGQPILTYVARNLEPYRGFHSFMRALPRILAAHPTCQVVVVGGDEVSYGSRPRGAANWRSKLLAENPVDLQRVHFLGKVPYATYKRVLQVSAAHIYLTYPFVLSWSLLEAMASGCLVIGSDTAPVREVIEDGRNGLLVDFFDTERIAEKALAALAEPERFHALRQQAAASARGYSTDDGVAGYLKVLGLDEVMAPA